MSRDFTKKQCDKKTLLAEVDTSKKRLMLVGGHADNAVDLCVEGNADAKRPCLGKGQTMLTKQPSSFCDGQTILSEGDGSRGQDGYLVSDGGFL